ncbi:MAG: NlpC/P60 family protein [Burkholderiales bacterium]|nr:NlpC/P60 family protein [Burkholderiales bacterium]MDP2398851.1 NlpC/P60 family protein [Burkholderiales bacterium]MDP3715180.1 NlpC/P60 family protein [Burkholderiales bacterium]
MAHWSERFVGKAYIEGEFDCAHFVEQVLREQFGREVNLPKEHAADYRAQQRQIDAEKAHFAEPVETPREGDAVLIVSRGRAEHLGVYCEIHGIGYVLHNFRAAGRVCLHRIRSLPAQGMALAGYYRWI